MCSAHTLPHYPDLMLPSIEYYDPLFLTHDPNFLSGFASSGEDTSKGVEAPFV